MTFELDPDTRDYIRDMVARAPRPTPEQRARLRAVIAPAMAELRNRALAGDVAAQAQYIILTGKVPAISLPGTSAGTSARPRPVAEPECYYLYRYWDSCGCLLYVGITDDPDKRDRQHKTKSPWRQFAAKRQVTKMTGRKQAAASEQEAVLAEHPAFNSSLRSSSATNRAFAEYVLSHSGGRHPGELLMEEGQ